MNLIKKIFDLKALDVDTKTKQVKVAISQLEDVDRDEDVFDPSAYDKTIKENGPMGRNEIWHLLDHTPRSFSALSKFKQLGKEGKYIVGVSHYKDSFAWREVAWPLYEAGDITQHSVGFEIIKAEPRNSKNIRIIKEVRLYEGSAVLWGAQPDTPTMQIVKGLLNLEDDREITAAEKIDELMKQIKKGRFEEDQSLLIIELKRLQYLFDTKQVSKIFEPDKTTQKEPSNDTQTCPHCGHKMPMDEGMKCPECGKNMSEPPENTQPKYIDCPSCTHLTYNTQKEKGYVKCHRCEAVFVQGGTLFIKN